MYIVTVLHDCKPEMMKEAVERIDSNGDQMAKIPGFVFRYRTESTNDASTIGTITGWADEAAYDLWIKAKANLPDSGPSPYLSAKNDRYFVRSSHGAPV